MWEEEGLEKRRSRSERPPSFFSRHPLFPFLTIRLSGVGIVPSFILEVERTPSSLLTAQTSFSIHCFNPRVCGDTPDLDQLRYLLGITTISFKVQLREDPVSRHRFRVSEDPVARATTHLSRYAPPTIRFSTLKGPVGGDGLIQEGLYL